MALSSSSVVDEKTLVFDFGTYRGSVHPTSGLRHGFGTLVYNSGNTYEGEWSNGACEGTGSKYYHQGDAYHGPWLAGRRHGKGEYRHVQGDTYTGEYVNDVCHGNGTFRSRNGDVFEGRWVNGQRHGPGSETMRNGNVFVGEWVRGKKHGIGTLTTATERIRGQWVADKCTEVLSKEEMEYQPQVRQFGVKGTTVASSTTGGGADDADEDAVRPDDDEALANGLALAPHMADDMRRAGADPALIASMQQFGDRMTRQMDTLLSGIGAVDGQLAALAEALEQIGGPYDDDHAGLGSDGEPAGEEEFDAEELEEEEDEDDPTRPQSLD